MKNEITTVGLDHIAGHLTKRIRGFTFSEVTVEDIGLRHDYTLYSVQTATELMMRHLVMIGYTPIIQLIDLPKGVAGLTNLNDSREVYISLDKHNFETRFYSPAQLLTIIAHELCHKFLWVHGFKETSSKVEYITDACVVYVGFGGIMAEGVERKTYSMHGATRSVQTHNIGYLTAWQIDYLRRKFGYIRGATIAPPAESKSSGCTTYVVIFALIVFALLAIGWLFAA